MPIKAREDAPTIMFKENEKYFKDEIQKALEYGSKYDLKKINCLIIKNDEWKDKDIIRTFKLIKKILGKNRTFSLKKIENDKKKSILSIPVPRRN